MKEPNKINVLIACEESQRVCIAFRERGFNAFSCDIVQCSGEHPEWHIQDDIGKILTRNICFHTENGDCQCVDEWDMVIAHPPCTYLTVTGNRWFNVERYGGKALERMEERERAVRFFEMFTYFNCPKIAIENPIGIMSTRYRKPDQIIQPWQFGHPTTKATCLWLKGLPKLIPTNIVEVDKNDVYEYVAANGRIKHDSRLRSKCAKNERSSYRSKTFEGIALAMAKQWGDYLLKEGD